MDRNKRWKSNFPRTFHVMEDRNVRQDRLNQSIPNIVSVSRLLQLLSLLKKLNEDASVHGIIVQMPLDCENEIDSHLVTDSVLPDKDIDG